MPQQAISAAKSVFFGKDRLRARNTNMFTLWGLRQDLSGVTMLPAVLNILSELVLVAQIHMYFCANLAIRGNLL